MALPHMPSYYTTRKNIYEAAIVSRRTKENDFREKWGNTADYFHKEKVAATKKKNWESDASFQCSMDAYKGTQEKELKLLNLKRRRTKLGDLLSEERKLLEAELKGLSAGNYLRLDDMKERSEELRSAREEKRQVLAQELMYDHWRQNNPDVRKLESRQQERHVIRSWKGQVDEQKEKAAYAKKELEELELHLEEERQIAIEEEENKQYEILEKEKELKNILRNQFDELKDREKEADRLKLEEQRLQRSKWEVEVMEAKQKEIEESRKKLQFGRVLLRQHGAALKHKSRQIQEELEEDRKLLELLADQEADDLAVHSARREKAQADAAWMKQVVEEQLKVEKAREAELDMLYQDEAARIWDKRESEWDRERQARRRLMKEVLEARQHQIQDKMEVIRELQKESLERREELVQDMDIANQITRREHVKEEEDRITRKVEIEAQVTARHVQQLEARRRLEEELVMEKKAEEDYEELLRREAEHLNIQGFAPKDYSRKTAWM